MIMRSLLEKEEKKSNYIMINKLQAQNTGAENDGKYMFTTPPNWELVKLLNGVRNKAKATKSIVGTLPA